MVSRDRSHDYISINHCPSEPNPAEARFIVLRDNKIISKPMMVSQGNLSSRRHSWVSQGNLSSRRHSWSLRTRFHGDGIVRTAVLSVRVRAVRACTCTDMYGQANVRASSRCTTKARLLTKTRSVPLNSVVHYLDQFSNNIGSMGMHSDKI